MTPETAGAETPERDSIGGARLIAVGAGCFWLLLGLALGLGSLLAAAVSVGAFVILGPWAIVALVLAARLLMRRPSRRVLVVSVLLGSVSVALSIAALIGSSADFAAGNITLAVMAVGATTYSLLAFWRLPPAM